MFYPALNPVNKLIVKKVNKKSLTCTSGTNWKYEEVFIEPERMKLWIRAAKCEQCNQYIFTEPMPEHIKTCYQGFINAAERAAGEE